MRLLSLKIFFRLLNHPLSKKPKRLGCNYSRESIRDVQQNTIDSFFFEDSHAISAIKSSEILTSYYSVNVNTVSPVLLLFLRRYKLPILSHVTSTDCATSFIYMWMLICTVLYMAATLK